VRYDPTPPDLRLASASALSASDRFAALQSALEFWWFRNVIDFDRSRQASALRSLWMAWRAWRAPREDAGAGAEAHRDAAPSLPLGPLGLVAAPLALGALALFALRRRRLRQQPAVPAYYRQALRLLSGRGARREAGDTARAFVARVTVVLGAGPALAFADVTELYLAERFGGRAPGAAGDEALRRLRDSLRR
jgi:hypothetical protein